MQTSLLLSFEWSQLAKEQLDLHKKAVSSLSEQGPFTFESTKKKKTLYEMEYLLGGQGCKHSPLQQIEKEKVYFANTKIP